MTGKNKPTVGLALSSGAARGLAHLGVLEVLDREEITIDMVAGTSAGALIGALYAFKKDIKEIKAIINDLSSQRFSLLSDVCLPRTGLISGKRLTDQLRSVFNDIDITALSIPFACIATDISTGEEVVIREGRVIEAIRASASIPGLFRVVKWNGRYLVDGGLVNPIPVNLLKKMGADVVIAVNVVPDMKRRVYHGNEEKVELKEPNLFSVLIRTVHISAYQAVRSCLERADIIIEPDVVRIGFGDFHRVEECVVQGRLAAERAMPEITRLLEM